MLSQHQLELERHEARQRTATCFYLSRHDNDDQHNNHESLHQDTTTTISITQHKLDIDGQWLPSRNRPGGIFSLSFLHSLIFLKMFLESNSNDHDDDESHDDYHSTSTSTTTSAHSVVDWNGSKVSNPLRRGLPLLIFFFTDHSCLVFSTTTRPRIFSSSFAMVKAIKFNTSLFLMILNPTSSCSSPVIMILSYTTITLRRTWFVRNHSFRASPVLFQAAHQSWSKWTT